MEREYTMVDHVNTLNNDIEMGFGKHKGKLLSEIEKTDPQYLIWLYDNVERLGMGIKNWIESHRKELEKSASNKRYIRLADEYWGEDIY